MRVLTYTVPPEYDGKKAVAFLRGKLGLSARLTASLKRTEGGITRGGQTLRTIDRLHAGDVIELRMQEKPANVTPEPVPLNVVYEDEDVLVIDKPAGLAMHPTHNHQGDTLANGVVAHLTGEAKAPVFKAVGRLDKSTSGLVVCALTRQAAAALNGKIDKTYLAAVPGTLEGSGTIDAPIIRPDPMKTLRAVGDGGLPAVTRWTAVCVNGGRTLVRVRLETGRTHQIRVHFAHLGAPLCGDDMYGSSDPAVKRAALHCESIAFRHPATGQAMRFSSPLPADMRALFPTVAATEPGSDA